MFRIEIDSVINESPFILKRCPKLAKDWTKYSFSFDAIITSSSSCIKLILRNAILLKFKFVS